MPRTRPVLDHWSQARHTMDGKVEFLVTALYKKKKMVCTGILRIHAGSSQKNAMVLSNSDDSDADCPIQVKDSPLKIIPRQKYT